jgi:hypothetical protein
MGEPSVRIHPAPGVTVPIPCRNCGVLHPLEVRERNCRVTCSRCRQVTEVRLTLDSDGWRVRTAGISLDSPLRESRANRS